MDTGVYRRGSGKERQPEVIEEGATTEAVQAAVPQDHLKLDLVGSRQRIRLPAVLTLLLSRRLLAALWGTLMVGALFGGLETVLPLQTEAAFGWDSIGGGLISCHPATC